MAPFSAKPLERIPGTLFEREEVPDRDVVDGCLRSVIIAHDRLRAIFELVPPSGCDVLLMLRAQQSAELLAGELTMLHGARVDANWRRE